MSGQVSNPQPPEKTKLTREQKRSIDRANQEVMKIFDSFAEKFFNFFVNHDEPNSFDVIDKLKTMDAQWRLYCKKRNLKVHAFPMFKEYAENLMKEYKEFKNGFKAGSANEGAKESQPETVEANGSI